MSTQTHTRTTNSRRFVFQHQVLPTSFYAHSGATHHFHNHLPITPQAYRWNTAHVRSSDTQKPFTHIFLSVMFPVTITIMERNYAAICNCKEQQLTGNGSTWVSEIKIQTHDKNSTVCNIQMLSR